MQAVHAPMLPDVTVPSQVLQFASGKDWDDPRLAVFVARETAIEDNDYDDEEVVNSQLVVVWQEAVGQDPSVPGAYLRLASALRDAQRYDEAADALRTGIRAGHEHLLTDLVADYPSRATESELRACRYPTLLQAALSALVTEHETDRALSVFRLLSEAEPRTVSLPAALLIQLSLQLLERGDVAAATQVHQALASLDDPRSDIFVQREHISEMIRVGTDMDQDLVIALSHLERTGRTVMLEARLLSRKKAERQRFFALLSQHCPQMAQTYREELQELSTDLVGGGPEPVAVAVFVLAVLAAVLWAFVLR